VRERARECWLYCGRSCTHSGGPDWGRVHVHSSGPVAAIAAMSMLWHALGGPASAVSYMRACALGRACLGQAAFCICGCVFGWACLGLVWRTSRCMSLSGLGVLALGAAYHTHDAAVEKTESQRERKRGMSIYISLF
jgi:hypothetical protein